MAVILACVLSLFIADVSIGNVWTGHPVAPWVFVDQNALGEYEGPFPYSKLSYPLYLNVYHTPLEQQSRNGTLSYGQARFSVFFANVKILRVNGTFLYDNPHVWVDRPLYYKIDFLFSDSPEFFNFLLALFTFFNIIGAVLGIVLAKTLYERLQRTR